MSEKHRCFYPLSKFADRVSSNSPLAITGKIQGPESYTLSTICFSVFLPNRPCTWQLSYNGGFKDELNEMLLKKQVIGQACSYASPEEESIIVHTVK